MRSINRSAVVMSNVRVVMILANGMKGSLRKSRLHISSASVADILPATCGCEHRQSSNRLYKLARTLAASNVTKRHYPESKYGKNVFILSPVELCECGPEYRVRAVCVSAEMSGVTRILRSVLRHPPYRVLVSRKWGTLYHAMISLIITLFCAMVFLLLFCTFVHS